MSMTIIAKSKLIAVAVLAIVVLIVVLQNTEAVETRILFLTLTMPRAALLFGTLIVGFVLGLLTSTRLLPSEKAD